jgi:serine phosphatase RsbU (regulator of sigma subunit)
VSYLTTGAPLIGCFADSQFEETTTSVAAGDTIVFYTDGVAESQNKSGQRYPMKRVEKIMIAEGEKPAREISAAIIDSLKEFAGSEPQADDVTVLVVKIL